MNEEKGSGQKTEKPTPSRIRDARKKGQVAKTEEAPVIARFIVVTTFFFLTAGGVIAALESLIKETFYTINQPFQFSLLTFLINLKQIALHYGVPFVLCMITLVYLSFVIQFGLIFSSESVKPSLKKISPVSGFKNLFSKKKLMALLKNILRVFLLSTILFYFLRYYSTSFEFLPYYGVDAGLKLLGHILLYSMIIVIIFSLIIAIADFIFEKKSMTKQLMMSKEDIKKELKENEGNPEIKEKRKELFKEIQSGSLGEKVKKSSVVVRNPTRIAVCVYYKPGETPLPVVIEKRKGQMAKHIVMLAQQYHIPVVTNVPVARELYDEVRVGGFIARNMMAAVASILHAVMTAEERKQVGKKTRDK